MKYLGEPDLVVRHQGRITKEAFIANHFSFILKPKIEIQTPIEKRMPLRRNAT
jgi:hypothetical protein